MSLWRRSCSVRGTSEPFFTPDGEEANIAESREKYGKLGCNERVVKLDLNLRLASPVSKGGIKLV